MPRRHIKLGRIGRLFNLPTKARFGNLIAPLLGAPPWEYNVDAHIRSLVPGVVIPSNTWGNDLVGDCTIAAQFNQTIRFALADTGKAPTLTAKDAERVYFSQTKPPGKDTGLVPEQTLSIWQKTGWQAGTYLSKIAGWARVDGTKYKEVSQCISLLGGLQLGFCLPQKWIDIAENDEQIYWDAPPSGTNDSDWKPNPNNGHQVFIYAYHRSGNKTAITWGENATITEAGFAWIASEVNGGECEGVVRLNADGSSPLDGKTVAALQSDLVEIAT